MFFSQLDLKLKVALGYFIGHSHWKSTRTTKCEQGVQEKWYSISLLGWSHYHIFLDFCFSCKSGILGLYCDTIILFFYQKVQHCGQACLLRHHMVLGIMVFCSNFLTFSLILTHSCNPFFIFGSHLLMHLSDSGLLVLKFRVGLTLLRLPPDTGLLKLVL